MAYHYQDLVTGSTSVWKQPTQAFDPAAFETRQIFFASKDPSLQSGHGGGSTLAQRVTEDTEVLALFARNLGLSLH